MRTFHDSRVGFALLRVVDLARSYSPRMSISQLGVFLAIAETPGISTPDLCKRFNFSDMAVLRNTKVLAELGWIEVLPDPAEGRRNAFNLTSSGWDVLERIIRAGA